MLKWDGNSWSLISTISGSPTLNSISIQAQNLIFAAGVQSSRGRIYKSTNSGSSWSLDYTAGSGTNLRGIEAVNPSLAFAVGSNGLIRRWAGSSWSSQTSPTSHDLYSIDSTSPSDIVAVGGNNGRAVIIRYNGADWSTVLNEQGDSFRDLIALSDKKRAVGDGGLVYEYDTSWKNNFNVPPAFEGTSTSGISCTLDQDSCSEQNSFPSLNANYSSCRAHQQINATVYSVGFGPVSTCAFATQTLQAIADCGNGTFYKSSNANELQNFYNNIAQEIIQLSYSEQTSFVEGNVSTKIYEDSYLEFNITKASQPFGLIATLEIPFTNSTTAYFTNPLNTAPLETRITSYSGPRWTSHATINNITIYDINNYGSSYIETGDPYSIILPKYLLNNTNTVTLVTGTSRTNISEGSPNNKIFHTFAKNATGYSPIVALSEGCTWTIEFQDLTNLTTTIPMNYSGTNTCYYQSSNYQYNFNDAIQTATFRLLEALDIDLDRRVDIQLAAQDIQISVSQLTGIPFTYATEVQVRLWY